MRCDLGEHGEYLPGPVFLLRCVHLMVWCGSIWKHRDVVHFSLHVVPFPSRLRHGFEGFTPVVPRTAPVPRH